MTPTEVNVLAAWLLAIGDDVRAAADAVGLSAAETSALVLVSNDPGRSLDWLRARLGLSHSGTVRLVDRLAALGLLQREVAPHDARSVALRTTSAGEQQVAQVHAVRTGVVAGLLQDLPPQTARALVELAAAQLRSTPRDVVQADVTCRLCQMATCVPRCPVEDSIVEEPEGPAEDPPRGDAGGMGR